MGRRSRRLLVVGLVGALVVADCGDDDGGTATTTTAPETSRDDNARSAQPDL
ncbi:MAG: hypothetical protein ABIJ48_12760 [Actinomycetota bacterium]